MKAIPLRRVEGEYVQCGTSEATHLRLKTPGPFEYRTLPIITHGSRRGTPCWTWNGDTEKPTLKPSVRTSTGKSPDPDFNPPVIVCHSWITDGKIIFLSDCTHTLAGTTHSLLEQESN